MVPMRFQSRQSKLLWLFLLQSESGLRPHRLPLRRPRSAGSGAGWGLAVTCLLCAVLIPQKLKSFGEQCEGYPFLCPQSTKTVEVYG